MPGYFLALQGEKWTPLLCGRKGNWKACWCLVFLAFGFFRIKRTFRYCTVLKDCGRGEGAKRSPLTDFVASNILYLPLPSLWKREGRRKRYLKNYLSHQICWDRRKLSFEPQQFRGSETKVRLSRKNPFFYYRILLMCNLSLIIWFAILRVLVNFLRKCFLNRKRCGIKTWGDPKL